MKNQNILFQLGARQITAEDHADVERKLSVDLWLISISIWSCRGRRTRSLITIGRTASVIGNGLKGFLDVCSWHSGYSPDSRKRDRLFVIATACGSRADALISRRYHSGAFWVVSAASIGGDGVRWRLFLRRRLCRSDRQSSVVRVDDGLFGNSRRF